jgi:multidrug/hemolysin transport system ATP-binding protein
MSNIIEVSDLVKKYNNKKVVDNLSFNVKEGSLFSFLGSNGAGKTTTISIITTLLKRDSGSVIIDSVNLDLDNDLIRKKVGIVFQGSYLDDLLTVEENLLTRGSFYYHSTDLKKQVNKVIKMLKLDNYIDQRYGTLSGGEKRRVDIVRALLHEPKILFLDEPTTGLDPANRQLVWEIIKKLQHDKKMTIFLTTHYMEEANESDIVGIIEKGKLIAFDSPYNLKNKYAYDTIKIKLKDLKDKKHIKEKYELNNDILTIKVEDSIKGLDIVNKYKEYISSVEILKGNMDDVFLNVTGSRIKAGV